MSQLSLVTAEEGPVLIHGRHTLPCRMVPQYPIRSARQVLAEIKARILHLNSLELAASVPTTEKVVLDSDANKVSMSPDSGCPGSESARTEPNDIPQTTNVSSDGQKPEIQSCGAKEEDSAVNMAHIEEAAESLGRATPVEGDLPAPKRRRSKRINPTTEEVVVDLEITKAAARSKSGCPGSLNVRSQLNVIQQAAHDEQMTEVPFHGAKEEDSPVNAAELGKAAESFERATPVKGNLLAPKRRRRSRAVIPSQPLRRSARLRKTL